MTIREVLGITIQMLKGVSLPISLMDTAGQDIRNAVHNLEACIEAIDRESTEQEGTDAP